MNKKEALAELEEHLSEAPSDLKEYALKSWGEQAKDVNDRHWSLGYFLPWVKSKEGMEFWDAIFNKNWQEAQAELSKPNHLLYRIVYDHINSDDYEPNWFEKLPLHWRYIYHMAGGILIGYLLHYLF